MCIVFGKLLLFKQSDVRRCGENAVLHFRSQPAAKGAYWTKPSASGKVSLVCEEPGVRAIADYTNLDVFSARVSAVLALPHAKSHSVAVLADAFNPVFSIFFSSTRLTIISFITVN